VRFQVGFPLSRPDDLDQRLAARGYEIHDPVTTLLKSVEPVTAPTSYCARRRPRGGFRSISPT
jgi:hypothetical protein